MTTVRETPDEEPDFWRCKTCGCLWRDNHVFNDESVSLSSAKQTSCSECEMKPTADVCEPLFRQPTTLPPPQICQFLIAAHPLPHGVKCVLPVGHEGDHCGYMTSAHFSIEPAALPRVPEPDLQALVVKWREWANFEFKNHNAHAGALVDQCADELEAVRAARAGAEAPPQEGI